MFTRPKRATRQASGGSTASKRVRLNPPAVTRKVPKSVEVKWEAEVPYDNENVPTGNSATLTKVASIAAGDSPYERNGRAIKILGHRVRMRWYKQNTVPETMLRVIMFRWNTGLANPSVSSILDTGGVDAVTADYNGEYKGIYKILHDKVYTITDFQERYNTTTGVSFTPPYHFVEQMIDFKVSDPHLRTFYIDPANGSGSSSTWLLITAMDSAAYINESNVVTEFVDV